MSRERLSCSDEDRPALGLLLLLLLYLFPRDVTLSSMGGVSEGAGGRKKMEVTLFNTIPADSKEGSEENLPEPHTTAELGKCIHNVPM